MGLKQKLNPQAENILDILSDGMWHCPIDWKYADGHGKRLTDINRYLQENGKQLIWEWCNCGRHTATIKRRRIAPITSKPAPQTTLSPNVAKILASWQKPVEKPAETPKLTLF
jgi:hypothetical protein